MTEAFIEKNFADSSLAIIEQANAIIAEYAAQGFRLTLRQLYYQFVARDVISNTQRSYKRLGNIISEARLAGLVDWDAIEDRTRNLETNPHWRDPASIIRAAADSFRIDKWENQDNRVEGMDREGSADRRGGADLPAPGRGFLRLPRLHVAERAVGRRQALRRVPGTRAGSGWCCTWATTTHRAST